MPPLPPDLSPEAATMLQIMMAESSIDGSTLMKHMHFSRPSDLIKPLRELQTKRLIEVGGTLTPETVPFARFAVLPSAKSYLAS